MGCTQSNSIEGTTTTKSSLSTPKSISYRPSLTSSTHSTSGSPTSSPRTLSTNKNNHPERKIYSLLESLNSLIQSSKRISDDTLQKKITKTLIKIEKILQEEGLPLVSPFLALEIQGTLETLQKTRPRIYKVNKDAFQRLIDLSNIHKRRGSNGSTTSTSNGGGGGYLQLTAPPTPLMNGSGGGNGSCNGGGIHRQKHIPCDLAIQAQHQQYHLQHQQQQQMQFLGNKYSIDSTVLASNSRTHGSSFDETFICQSSSSAIKLKSFYQNTLNHSQETLGDFGFFED